MADVAYVIRLGTVEILKHGDSGEIKLAELSEGEIFGEMGLFDPKSPRSATARTVTETVVDLISDQELQAMINQSPPRLIPIITSVFERLRASNQRISSHEQATVLLETDISKIIVSPASEILVNQFQPMEMPVAHLPFKIGGYAQNGEINRTKGNHLYLASDGPPLTVSASHCEIVVQDGGIFLRDLGSRFGTTVNGTTIGRGKGHYKTPLQKGDNYVLLGEKKTSPYYLNVTCV